MNTNKSEKAYEDAKKVFPGGVNSPVRAYKSVDLNPPFIDRGEGSHIYDIDGNEYIDYVLSWGPLVLGHCEHHVVDALTDQLHKGTTFGAPTTLETRLARKILAVYSSMEEMRFVNSGTEATMSALRLARGVTGRDIMVKFDGCYHGHGDSFLVKAGSGVATYDNADSAGVPEALADLTVSLPYNDVEALKDYFTVNGDKVACVIVEPVAGNMGTIEGSEDFIRTMRDLCDQYGAILIFDEVMSGFRTQYPAGQGYYGVQPDLLTLGKIIGGGLPAAAFCGSRDLMSHISPDGNVYQAGTLSGNPLAMVAGYETLAHYTEEDYQAASGRMEALTSGLRDRAAHYGIPVQVHSKGLMGSLFFSEKEVNNYDDAKNANQDQFKKYFQEMLNQGIYLPPSQFETCFISTKHTDEDIEKTLDAADVAFSKL